MAKRKTNNSSRATLVLVTVITLVIIVAAGFVFINHFYLAQPGSDNYFWDTPGEGWRSSSSPPSQLFWQTYKDAQYGYQISYPPTLLIPSVEVGNSNGSKNIRYVWFKNECLSINLNVFPNYPKVTNLSKDEEMLAFLETAPVGTVKAFTVESLKETKDPSWWTRFWLNLELIYFKRLAPREIDQQQWASFDITTNIKQINSYQGTRLYFTRKNGSLYAISVNGTKSGSGCYMQLPDQALNSFHFIPFSNTLTGKH